MKITISHFKIPRKIENFRLSTAPKVTKCRYIELTVIQQIA